VDLLDAYRAGVGPEALTDGLLFNGGPNVVGPDGSWIVEPVVGEACTIIAALDLDRRYEELLDLDVAGHYARPDVFRLTVDRSRRDSAVRFTGVQPESPGDRVAATADSAASAPVPFTSEDIR
jgi:nitrilase